MNDFLSGVKEAFNSRFGSTMYGTFILARLTTNWKFWVILFFIEEKFILDKYSLLKNEYLVSLYSLSSFWCGARTISKLVLIPALVTYLVHWILSKVETRVYEKGLSNKTERKIIKANEEKKFQKATVELEKQKGDILEIQKQNIEKEIEIKTQEQKIQDEEIIWKENYEEIKQNTPFIKSMEGLKKTMYANDGYYYDILNEETLGYLHVNGFIDIDGNRISVTKKGKFFMKNFINNSI